MWRGIMVILLLILAGCCGFTPDSYRDHREEGPVRGLFTGPEGELSISSQKP